MDTPKAAEKATAKAEAVAEKAEAVALEAGGQAWWHDADHGADAERNAAQKARDEAAGYGPPKE